MSRVHDAAVSIAKTPAQQIYPHEPMGDVGYGCNNRPAWCQASPRQANNGRRVRQMLQNVRKYYGVERPVCSQEFGIEITMKDIEPTIACEPASLLVRLDADQGSARPLLDEPRQRPCATSDVQHPARCRD